ncbi:hypothetical protein GS582_13650 [Rhodococcus hoagii]|nr:hypothetical protein [Prescottella equi]
MRKALSAVALVAVWSVAGSLPAGAAQPSWSGDYSVKRFAATKTVPVLVAAKRLTE